jgi:hypothetical protein
MDSANFAFWGFSAPLCQAALREGACESATSLLNTASETRLLRHLSASLGDLGLVRLGGHLKAVGMKIL